MGDDGTDNLNQLWWTQVFTKLTTAFPESHFPSKIKKMRFRTRMTLGADSASFPIDSKKRSRR